ncbi:MAG TPA: ActS/PrrB/RegB family redox-sensitive histidine kinase [Caulobacteraceae bacterium]|jgi:two-component system sensor histidine kinase RegB|nr:ActS/PrrB/RegB family redox-sensitive histidine kinase [Caulobacteraceae bacterium]
MASTTIDSAQVASGVPHFQLRGLPGDTPAGDPAQVPGLGVGRIKTRTLIVLRLLGVVGQALAILFVGLVLRFPLPYLPCSIIVGASALFNLLLMISPASRRLAKTWEAGGQLVFDIAQIAGLLLFTGGVTNPFCILMIIPVTVGFATLPTRWAVAIGIIAATLSLTLAFGGMPLPWGGPQPIQLPLLYRGGCAVALMLAMAVTGGFSFWSANRASRMELALHVTETVLAREQRVSALGALAAAAAHELGTPLTTISVVAKELARATPQGPLREDAWLLINEAQRCRGILKRLTDEPETLGVGQRMTLADFLQDVVAPYDGDPEIRVRATVTGVGAASAPVIWRRTEIFHALGAIVENAFDFAKADIQVTAKYDARSITLEVVDDGPGFASEIIDRLGDPYVTTRPGAEGSRTGHVGMGLGFFIAKTLLERTGATVAFRNGRRRGASVSARWLRSAIEAAA